MDSGRIIQTNGSETIAFSVETKKEIETVSVTV
jgi:hypothetical protein